MILTTEPRWLVTQEKVDSAVKRLVEAGNPRKIFLFGSYVRGDLHLDSDVDVLVVVGDEISNTRKESVRLRHALDDIDMSVDILVVRETVFEALKDQIGLIYREAVLRGRLVYDVTSA